VAFASYILANEAMIKTETSRRSPYVVLGILIVAAAVTVFTVRSCSSDDVEVRVAPVTFQNLISSVSTNGKVEPVNEFQAHAPNPGVVEKIYVEAGQKVKAGDMLVQMRDPYASARVATATSALRAAESMYEDEKNNGSIDERTGFAGDLSRAKLQQEQAQQNLAALKQLHEKGAASASEVTASEQRLKSANSSLETLNLHSTKRYSQGEMARAQAQLSDAKAGVQAAQGSYAGANIRSPISGTVYSVPVSEYDFVQPGDDLLAVADLNRIKVRAYFDEPEVGKLSPGQAVKIVWDAKPNQTWHGHVEEAPTTIVTYGTRNVGECIITVDDAKNDLPPNSNVVVTVTTSQSFNVLSIPREALHTDGANTFFVFRIVNNKLVRTPVQVGKVVNLTRAEISSGLTDKDQVVLGAIVPRDLANGLAVKIVP
jgi:HlyD family secretion protein